jgi:hypothetical protein
MEYQIALSPNLGLSPADFITAWNEDPDTRTIAEASLSETSSASYNPLLDATMAILGTVSSGIAINVLSDLLKQLFVKKGIHKHTRITEVKKPDGTHILIIDIEEK